MGVYTIGIDLGGTNMRVALIKDGTTIVKKAEQATETQKGAADAIARMVSMVAEVDPERKASAIGIGSAGPLDLEHGIILKTPNLVGWEGTPIVDLMRQGTGREVYLNNDANVAGLAEAVFGGGKGCKSSVFITASTGVGGGIVVNGHLLEGAYGYGGEIGCMIVADDDRKHDSLYAGTLESLCSGSALNLQAQKIYGPGTNAAYVFQQYAQNDMAAMGIIELWLEHFSRGLASLMQIVDPEVFVIGGSVVLHNPWLLEQLPEHIRPKVYEGLRDKINLRLPELGGDAGLIGAAYLAHPDYLN